VTFEARLASVIFFLFVWAAVALLPWAAAAVIARGRGAAPALPLCIAAGCAAGVLVPVLGARDATGFFVSLFAAFFASALAAVGGIWLARRLAPEATDRPGVTVSSTRRRPPG
jgi:hypothetical protein